MIFDVRRHSHFVRPGESSQPDLRATTKSAAAPNAAFRLLGTIMQGPWCNMPFWDRRAVFVSTKRIWGTSPTRPFCAIDTALGTQKKKNQKKKKKQKPQKNHKTTQKNKKSQTKKKKNQTKEDKQNQNPKKKKTKKHKNPTNKTPKPKKTQKTNTKKKTKKKKKKKKHTPPPNQKTKNQPKNKKKTKKKNNPHNQQNKHPNKTNGEGSGRSDTARPLRPQPSEVRPRQPCASSDTCLRCRAW